MTLMPKPDKNATNKQNCMNRDKNHQESISRINCIELTEFNSTLRRLHTMIKTGFMPGIQGLFSRTYINKH